MTKNDIIRKMTSRKFWVAVAGFVAGLIVAFDGDAATAETVSGLILQGASVLGYIIAEGLADSVHIEEQMNDPSSLAFVAQGGDFCVHLRFSYGQKRYFM